MTRPLGLVPRRSRNGRFRPPHRCGYTLVEILTATVLMLIIMMAVTVIFASVTDSIGQSRATLEMTQRTRATVAILKQDLENVTAVMSPPRDPRDSSGYFVYVEGPIGPVVDPSAVAVNTDATLPDTTVGDIDDILMFTATTRGEPYVGLIAGQPSVSNSAEIIYFVRGNTLYRRVLLVKPETDVRTVKREGFYQSYDLSVRKNWDDYDVNLPSGGVQHRPVLAANSLADLTRPECRFGYNPDLRIWSAVMATPTGGVTASPKLQRANNNLRYWNEGKPFPFFLRPWLGSPFPDPIDANFKWVPGLGLPILAECSDPNWTAGDFVPTENPVGIAVNNPNAVQMPRFPSTIEANSPYDAWRTSHPWLDVDPLTGTAVAFPNGTRRGEDVILTNVIGFDVKAWDPNAAIFTQTIENPPSTVIDNIVLMPGDPGYAPTVTRLQQHIQANTVNNSGLSAVMGAYVDLNYLAGVPVAIGNVYPDYPYRDLTGNVVVPVPSFAREGASKSLAYGTRAFFVATQQPYDYFPAVYDTWSLHYEYNRHWVNYVSENPTDSNRVSPASDPASLGYVGDEDRDGTLDEGTDGLDNDNANGVDDVGERETQPPYAVPLQGIQVSIRVFEPGRSARSPSCRNSAPSRERSEVRG